MVVEQPGEPAVTMAEAQAFVRIETGEEEALLAGMVRSACALCEAFVGQVLTTRSFCQDMAASGTWQRLDRAPVQAISLVEAVGDDGSATPLPTTAYGVDIDPSGDGWVRVIDAGAARRIRVTATAGMAMSSNDVPEPIRHGVLRLVAHMFASRDGSGGEPPAAVTALWRPYRRLRLASGRAS